MSRPFVANLTLRKAELVSQIADLNVAIGARRGKIGQLLASSREAIANLNGAVESIKTQIADLIKMKVDPSASS